MKCKYCENAPKTYEEYCKAKRYEEPSRFCPDAYEPQAYYCTKVVNKNVTNEELNNE